MPRANSRAFIIPTDSEKTAYAKMVDSLLTGELHLAETIASSNHYELIQYTDLGDDEAQGYLIKEVKPIQKGWGLYIFRLGGFRNLIIEAPHPIADEGTALAALKIYRALDAGALLVAGAHRDANRDGSADVAHNPQTVFQAIHESYLHAAHLDSGPMIVLQIHGFASNKHPGYPQVVLGHDQGTHTDLLERLADELTTEGVRVGICDGTLWRDLCGTTNVQSTAMDGGIFIHIELDETMRLHNNLLLTSLERVFGE